MRPRQIDHAYQIDVDDLGGARHLDTFRIVLGNGYGESSTYCGDVRSTRRNEQKAQLGRSGRPLRPRRRWRRPRSGGRPASTPWAGRLRGRPGFERRCTDLFDVQQVSRVPRRLCDQTYRRVPQNPSVHAGCTLFFVHSIASARRRFSWYNAAFCTSKSRRRILYANCIERSPAHSNTRAWVWTVCGGKRSSGGLESRFSPSTEASRTPGAELAGVMVRASEEHREPGSASAPFLSLQRRWRWIVDRARVMTGRPRTCQRLLEADRAVMVERARAREHRTHSRNRTLQNSGESRQSGG